MRLMLLLLLLLCFAIPAFGADSEIVLGGTAAIRYDTNVTNRRVVQTGSFGIEVGPSLLLRSTGRDYNFGLTYVPTYTYNANRTVRGEWRHDLRFNSGWQVQPQTRITLDELFSYQQNASRQEFDDSDFDPAGDDVQGVADQLRNIARMSVNHTFNPRVSWNTEFSHRLNDNQNNSFNPTRNFSSSTTLAGSTRADYGFTEKLKLGGGVRVSYVSVDNSGRLGVVDLGPPPVIGPSLVTGTTTTYSTIFGSINYLFTPRISFNFSVGPTYVITNIARRKDIPESANPSPDDVWTWFAQGGLSGSTQKTTTSLSYRRSEGVNPLSALAQTTDSINITSRWNPFQNWAFGVRFGFSRRVNSVPVIVSNTELGDRLDQFTAALTGSRRLGRRMRGHITATYLYQKEYFFRTGVPLRNSDRFQIWFRIDYNSAPFRF
jgi:hypothetical protein